MTAFADLKALRFPPTCPHCGRPAQRLCLLRTIGTPLLIAGFIAGPLLALSYGL